MNINNAEFNGGKIRRHLSSACINPEIANKSEKSAQRPPSAPNALRNPTSMAMAKLRTQLRALNLTGNAKPRISSAVSSKERRQNLQVYPKPVRRYSLQEGIKSLSIYGVGGGNAWENTKTYSTNCKKENSEKSFNKLKDIKKILLDGNSQVVLMVGAGISTPSGIPDFRSPGTGLYDNISQYNIPYPEAIFDLSYFHQNPRPFMALAKEIWPSGKYHPNYIHFFIKLLEIKGRLLRIYSQNIDGLEQVSGVSSCKIVEAHGTFNSATCVQCGTRYKGQDLENVKKIVMEGSTLPRCNGVSCHGIVKPDVVFFGEALPKKFFQYFSDFPRADLLIVMGTSLEVEPFASLVNTTRVNTTRLLINRDVVGPWISPLKKKETDIFIEGDLIKNICRIVKMLGWQSDIETIIFDYWNNNGNGGPIPPNIFPTPGKPSDVSSSCNRADQNKHSSIDDEQSLVSFFFTKLNQEIEITEREPQTEKNEDSDTILNHKSTNDESKLNILSTTKLRIPAAFSSKLISHGPPSDAQPSSDLTSTSDSKKQRNEETAIGFASNRVRFYHCSKVKKPSLEYATINMDLLSSKVTKNTEDEDEASSISPSQACVSEISKTNNRLPAKINRGIKKRKKQTQQLIGAEKKTNNSDKKCANFSPVKGIKGIRFLLHNPERKKSKDTEEMVWKVL